MHMSKLILGTAAAVAFASAVSAAGLTATETMQCKLTNVAKDAALYNGICTVTQEVSGSSTIYTVKMGSGEPFLFASSDGKTWMHGPEEVQFRDLGKGAIFKWSDFALSVAE